MVLTPAAATPSTTSGICVQPMEPEVSISNMIFGLAWAGLLLAKGTFEMSVVAASARLTLEVRRSNVTLKIAFVRWLVRDGDVRAFICFSRYGRQDFAGISIQKNLGVTGGVSRSGYTGCHAKIRFLIGN